MTAVTLLGTLSRRRIRLTARGDRLIATGPRGTITLDDQASIVGLKPQLLALLAPEPGEATGQDEQGEWPEEWAADFETLRMTNHQAGYEPGEAARLAFETLRVRAIKATETREPRAFTWREIATWRWGNAPLADKAEADPEETRTLDVWPEPWWLEVASWPHERWVEWRDLAAQRGRRLDHPASVAEIQVAARDAYEQIKGE